MDNILFGKALLGAVLVGLITFFIPYFIVKKFWKSSRPPAITTLCVLMSLGFLSSTLSIVKSFAPTNITNVLLTTGTFMVGAICIYGIWGMRKWGALTYLILAILRILLGIYFGSPAILLVFILLLFPLTIIFLNYKKMS